MGDTALDELFGPLGGDDDSKDLLDAVDGMGHDLISVSSKVDEILSSPPPRLDNYGGLYMDGFYHPSFVAHRTCPTAYYHHRMQEPDSRGSFSPKTLRIFHNGDHVHLRLQSYMRDLLYGSWSCRSCHTKYNVNVLYGRWLSSIKKSDPRFPSAQDEISSIYSYAHSPTIFPGDEFECRYCGHQVPPNYEEWRVVDFDRGIAGKMDGVLMTPSGELMGWEIKSANMRSFLSLKPGSALLEKYRKQFAMYLQVCGFKTGVITVECKDNQDLKDFYVDASEVDLSQVYASMRESSEHARAHGEPPPPVRNPDCKDCPFLHDPCIPSKS